LDLGTTFAFLEAWAPRVSCKQHGVVVAAVPWARHDSGLTRTFEDQVAWLAVHTNNGDGRADANRVAHGRVDLRAGDGRAATTGGDAVTRARELGLL
jgi:hypothetical protein